MANGAGRTNRRALVVKSAISLISLLLIAGTFIPAAVRASMLSDFLAGFAKSGAPKEGAVSHSETRNIQTMTLLTPAKNIDPSPARGGGGVVIVDDTALVPSEGPSGTMADIEKPKNGTISIYIVREGDTLTEIAKLFKVKPSTILWANDLQGASMLRVGQSLTILPITGMRYSVKTGDTLASIAKKLNADAEEIRSYNGVEGDLAVGDELLVPNGEIDVPAPQPHHTPASKCHKKSCIGPEPAHNVGPIGTLAQIGYFVAPLADYVETQGIHGFNAVDLAAPIGTPIFASASGDVIVAKQGGYNGGYGSYVVIQHDNGSQTLYGHMSKVSTYDGQSVVQGQVIGYVGSSGKSTGAHLHFEIRNGIRNPF